MGRFQCDDAQLPTIGDCRADGMRGFNVHCMTFGCQRSGWLSFDELRLQDATIFIDIAVHRRLVCAKCGARTTEISPDWRNYVARGNGRRVIGRE